MDNVPEHFEEYLRLNYPAKFSGEDGGASYIFPWSTPDHKNKCNYVEKKLRTSLKSKF